MKLDYKQFSSLPELVKAIKAEGLADNSLKARHVISKMVPREHQIIRDVESYLWELKDSGVPIFYWKENTKDLPHLCMVIKNQFFAFVVRRPFIGQLTDQQHYILTEINDAGGIGGIITSVENVKEIFKEHGVI